MYYAVGSLEFDNPFDCSIHVPIDKDIWAFSYKEDERALNLICKPVKGRIKDDGYIKYFYEYKVLPSRVPARPDCGYWPLRRECLQRSPHLHLS